MPGIAPSRAKSPIFCSENEYSVARIGGDKWNEIATSAIFILGSPRSGTSWLAKIFDSHPDILYRHEPDEALACNPAIEPLAQTRAWLLQRGLRASAKRPHFRKSWRPAPLEVLRQSLASILALGQRTPLLCGIAERIHLPDLIPSFRARVVRGMIKLVNCDGAAIARTMPDARFVFILRHPCGQIASVMAGLAARHFLSIDDGVPGDLRQAAAFAATRGVDATAFVALPEVAKYAWAWLSFNEPAVEELRSLSNARIVVYEDLCQQPKVLSRKLFTFVGLSWQPSTTAFLDVSTRNNRGMGYYDVFRATGQVADRWRQTMTSADQDAVRRIIATSSLARCWPDLAAVDG